MPKIEVVRLQTISAIHTGGIDRRSKDVKSSGILGSIRWWYEVLVRGFGAYACDPSEADSCQFNTDAYQRTGKVEEGLRDVCPACRFFGCTGWSKKFKLQITDKESNFDLTLNKPDIEFQLHFIERKPFLEEEKWLLSRVFILISKYGSMGGKTTLKPPKFPDFGLVKLLQNINSTKNYSEMIDWFNMIMTNSDVLSRKLEIVPKEYPNLRFFFFNRNIWLDRQQMNLLVASDHTGFMKGARGISKKLFSFSQGEGKRFWGYTTGEEMLNIIMDKLNSMQIEGTHKGEEVMLSEL